MHIFGDSGVVINDSITSEQVGQPLVINSDFESHGDGTVTVAGTKVVNANNSDIDRASGSPSNSDGTSSLFAQAVPRS